MTKLKYLLAIFDMDGTILNTLEDLTRTTNAALAAQGMPQHTMNEVRLMVGNGIRRLIERAVPAGTAAPVIEETLTVFNQYYAAHCGDHTCPYPGIPELLQALRQAGMYTAVVSNKADYGVQELCRQYFPGQFDVAVGQRDGIRTKPAPDAVLAVLKQLQVAPEQAVFIGDSDVDVCTARNAGLPCFAVDWGFRERTVLEQAGATAIFSDAAALQQALLGNTAAHPQNSRR